MNNTKGIILAASAVGLAGVAVVCLAITTWADHHDQPAPEHWANRQLADAGYDTPEAALKTLLWGINNGDTDTFLASLAPETNAKVQKAWQGKLDTIMHALRQGLGKTTDFQIVGKQSANDEVTLDLVSTLGDGRTYDRKFTFKKFGNDWKCAHVFPIPHIDG